MAERTDLVRERPAIHAYPEVGPVLAFLEDSHVALAESVGAWASNELLPRPEHINF